MSVTTDLLERLPRGRRRADGAAPRAATAHAGWRWLALVAAAGVLLPVVVVAGSIVTPTSDVWAHLWATRLPGAIVQTLLLLSGVAVGTLVLGAGLAWLTAAYEFPGRRLLAWLLVLPLAMPAYVLGFVFLAMLGVGGPVQGVWQAVFGAGAWFPEVRSIAGAATVMSLTLYPYVYLLARAAFREQAATTFEAARTLGSGRLHAARRVVLPLARPSLAAGLTFVLLEVLTDYATVQYFNVETVSVSVVRVWKGMFDRVAATEVAAIVLFFAVVIIGIERLLRRRARFHQQGGASRGISPTRLVGWRGWAATGICGVVLIGAFVGPVAQLVAWWVSDVAGGAPTAFSSRFGTYLGHSLTLAAGTALACILVALVVANATRLNGDPLTRAAARATTFGYAVPGPVIAIGVLTVLAGTDRLLAGAGLSWGSGLLVTGSVAGLFYAYVVRFLALGYHTVEASFEKVTPSMTLSALTLGASPLRVLRRIHLPLVRSGIGVGLLLVTIDALKELPIVLLLRPFGWDTLSVWVWQLASESRWQAAALPALVIIAAATVPVVLLFRRSVDGATADVTPTPHPEARS